ncbi:MAG TPA: hypothetical protein VN325_16915, partial [Steroidobacteraceae bacterium]|nr:hypothetical protein [Steroidobacteraceae bacterium]
MTGKLPLSDAIEGRAAKGRRGFAKAASVFGSQNPTLRRSLLRRRWAEISTGAIVAELSCDDRFGRTLD